MSSTSLHREGEPKAHQKELFCSTVNLVDDTYTVVHPKTLTARSAIVVFATKNRPVGHISPSETYKREKLQLTGVILKSLSGVSWALC